MPGANTTTQVGGYGGSGGAGGDLLSTNNLSDVASAATSRTNLGFSTLTDYVTLTGTQTLTNKTLTTPTIADIRGTNAKSVLKLTDGASNVNYWDVFASNTGAGITIRGGGTDTNITASFYGKGAGETNLGIATAAATSIYGLQVNAYTTNGTLNLTTAGILGLTTTTANTNSVVNVEQRVLSTSGTAATGLGLSKASYIEVSGGSSSLAATESVYLTDGTSGAANVLWTLDAGSSNLNAFEILGSSGIKMGGSTGGYVTIKPSATAGDWTLTLPADDGTSGQYLKTDGSGGTSWDTPAGGGGSTLTATMSKYLGETGGGTPKYVACLTASKYLVIAGYTNVIISNSGSWSTVAHGGAASSLTAVYSNGDNVVACGTGTTWRRSTDGGSTWANVVHGLTAQTYNVMGVNGSTWVVAHSNSASNGGISTDNGATWTPKGVLATQAASAVLSNGGTDWLCLTTATAVRKSTDSGGTWANGTAGSISPTWGVYAVSKYWAINTAGALAYTPDTSTAWTTLLNAAGTTSCRAFGYANSKFCIADSQGNFWTCADPSSSNVWVCEGRVSLPHTGVANVLYYDGKYHIANGDGSTFVQVYTIS